MRVTLSRRARQNDAPRTIQVAEQSAALSDFQQINATITGDHDHQGVFFARGPGVAPGFIGQRAVPTAFHDLLWHLTDKVDAIDRLLPLARRLGLIDRATTLDLTPTVLDALGLPVARDMAGRPLREIFSPRPRSNGSTPTRRCPSPQAAKTRRLRMRNTSSACAAWVTSTGGVDVTQARRRGAGLV